MAGLTTTFLPKPSQSPPSLSLSSLHLSIVGLRLCSPNSFNFTSQVSALRVFISARYGGGSSSLSGPGDNKRSREDQALDLSTIRSDNVVRLIDQQQNMVGVVSKRRALEMAEDAELDLVILSPDADPPVLRIMDYNKYKYEQQKKKREQQKKSAASRMDLKELKMGYNIDVHDYSVRLKAARKFLKDGDKVKVIVNLKGREKEFKNNAIELIRRFQDDVGELAIEESKNFSVRNIFMVLVPNKAVVQKAQELPKKKKKSSETEVSVGV